MLVPNNPCALDRPLARGTRSALDGGQLGIVVLDSQSETAQRRELLEIKIKALFEANNSEYGYRRIHAALVRGGESVDDETVRKIMRDLGLEPCQPRPWRFSLTEQDSQAGPIPDLVNGDFSASKRGEKMVGDITYIDTWEGWVYLATVIDCATRKIAGWAMGDNYKTPLISSAIEMAARNLDLPEGTIFHSDRGSNYTRCPQATARAFRAGRGPRRGWRQLPQHRSTPGSTARQPAWNRRRGSPAARRRCGSGSPRATRAPRPQRVSTSRATHPSDGAPSPE